jgi:hypothetical protein
LEILDRGTSFNDFLQLAINEVFGTNPKGSDIVSLFYHALTNGTAPQDLLDTYGSMIDSGSLTAVDLAYQVTEHELNLQNINLVGLAFTGLVYI